MFIDTHAHIYLPQFNKDLKEVVERAKKANVFKILLPNIDTGSIASVYDLSHQFPGICYPMIGLHPCSVRQNWKEEIAQMESHIKQKETIAIGEIGIDLYWEQERFEEQKDAFEWQIQLALENELPIAIHSRTAIKHTIDCVSKYQNGSLTGVFHCFDQDSESASQILDLGFYVGIGGIITYRKNESLRDVVAAIPLERIILETDAPYLPPVPFRGKRNEPSYIPIIAETIAEIHGVALEEVKEATTASARKLFKI